MHRAYSLITVKAVDEEKRILTGIATTPSPDRIGDIVEPKGAEFKLPIPFLWQHNASQPIGHVTKAKVTSAGIEVEIQLQKINEPGTLKDRLDEAWQSFKTGLVRGLSIGFKALEFSRLEDGGLRFLRWAWLELSGVTIAANQDATITAIKSLDSALLAATGQKRSGVVHLSPGASGISKTRKSPEGKDMKTITEQIKEWEAKRQAKAAQAEALMAKSVEEGRTLDAAEKEQRTTLSDEVKEIDEHIAALVDTEKMMKTKAKPVNGEDPDKASDSRDSTRPNVQVLTPKLDKGIGFARYILCLANSRLTSRPVLDVAKQYYPEYAPLHQIVKGVGGTVDTKHLHLAKEMQWFEKAAVAGGTTAHTDWATALVEYQVLANEFIEFLLPRTILGQFGTGNIPSLNRVPFNIKVPRQTTMPVADWVGEGKPKPLSKFITDQVTLDFHKVAVIAAITEELARFSRPGAEALVRNQLARAVARKLDNDFIDPAITASAGIRPASVTNGAPTFASATTTGTVTEVITDILAIIAEFNQENIDLAGLVWVMNRNVALALSLMQTDLGNKAFPGISMNGGEFQGLPVLVSQYVPEQLLVLISTEDVYLADDGNVSIDISREASLEMLDTGFTQDGTTGTGTSLVSLWQTNMIGIKAEREITWLKRRTGAVVYLTGFNPNGTAGSGDI